MNRTANIFEPARRLATFEACYCLDLCLCCDDLCLDLTGRAPTS